MTRRYLSLGFCVFIFWQTGYVQPHWAIDSASVIFEIRNAGFTVDGSFSGLKATLTFDPEIPESGTIAASLEGSTINTGIKIRDKHLLKQDYFYIEKHPLIKMRSVRIVKNEPGHFKSTFWIDIKGIRREVSFPFTFSQNIFQGSFTINRLDFNLGESSPILSDEVEIYIFLKVSPLIK